MDFDIYISYMATENVFDRAYRMAQVSCPETDTHLFRGRYEGTVTMVGG